jgi:hypothetical protein
MVYLDVIIYKHVNLEWILKEKTLGPHDLMCHNLPIKPSSGA